MKVMMIFALCLGLLACHAKAKAVLAHFMVGNTAHYTQATWEDEMRLAAASGVDAFALNIAHGEGHNNAQLDLAFNAAAARGFKLLYSFDYAGGSSPWPKETVLTLLRRHATKGTYLTHNGLPLVSTFEGPDQAGDWNWIKPQFNVFFVPDWSSKGAAVAINLPDKGSRVANGLFNWAAWPDQPDWPKETYVDASYKVALGGTSNYMMPVSPWFYTNLPGFDKNWLWRGEMLWYDRWVQTLHVQPEWVQIISWNDYGESHYIGPIRGEQSLIALNSTLGKPPFNYVRGIEHGAWRGFLPYMTQLYKTGTATVTQEGLNVWYRLQPQSAGCSHAGTTAYTATHMQIERPWTEGLRDGIYFAALLGSTATATVTVGGTVFTPTWRYFPEGGVGVYVGFVHTQLTGAVKVEIKRGATTVVSLTGERPIGGCQDGFYNFNPVVYLAWGPTITAKSPPVKIDKGTPCVAGNGIGDFQALCQTTCKYNYCPIEACMCTKWGTQQGLDIVRGPPGHAAPNRDTNFEGLCNVACSYGKAGICPSTECSMVETLPPRINPISPFTAKSCTAGYALKAVNPGDQAARDQICAFGCRFGYCPTEICVCTGSGVLVLPQNVGVQYTGEKPGFKSALVGIRLLCKYTCGWGMCPAPVCKFPPAPPPPTATALPNTGLNKDSSCQQQADTGRIIDSSLWETTGAGEVLKAWFDSNPGTTNWYANFSMDKSVYSTSICAIDNPCASLNCITLKDHQTTPGSAAILNILLSGALLSQYLSSLKKAVTASHLTFAATSAWDLVDFWKRDNPLTATAKQWFNGINAGLGMIGAYGGPIGGSGSAVATGFVNSMQISMDTPIEFKDLAALQVYASKFYKSAIEPINKAHQDLFSNGQFNSLSIQTVLDKGAFLDVRDIPTLNSDKERPQLSVEKIGEILHRGMLTSMINMAWRKAGLILMAYPMTRAEFDAIKLSGEEAGTKYFKYISGENGMGYFYQSWEIGLGLGAMGTHAVTSQWPLGFDKLSTRGIDWQDPFVTSFDAYDYYGWNYTANFGNIDTVDNMRNIPFGSPNKVAGMFNIPICEVALRSNAPKTVKDFEKMLSGRNVGYAATEFEFPTPHIAITQFPGYCECQDVGGLQGGKLAKFTDVALTPEHWEICGYPTDI